MIFPTGGKCLPSVTAGAPSVGSPAHGGAGSIHATRKNDELRRRRRRRLEQCERAEKWRNTMDVSKYLGNAFLTVGAVKVNGPSRVVIENVTEGKFDKPDLTFDDGTRLSLNVTNTRTLARAYGTDGADWIGKEIELYLGEIPYEGKLQESILVKPISPPIEKRPPPKPKGESDKRGDLDDEIPFSAGDESKSGRSNRLSRPRLVNS
jgi:hypothetical protein